MPLWAFRTWTAARAWFSDAAETGTGERVARRAAQLAVVSVVPQFLDDPVPDLIIKQVPCFTPEDVVPHALSTHRPDGYSDAGDPVDRAREQM